MIAGGGIAALEALLALHEHAPEHVRVEMFAPDPSFRHRPLSVTEPFGLGSPRTLDLEEVALEHGATFLIDALEEVDVEHRVVRTAERRELGYDALVVATGVRSVEAVPGAVTFRDATDRGSVRSVLEAIERHEVRSVAFAVPSPLTWPLGLYELALLTTHRARELGAEVAVKLVTPETSPLAIFGRPASQAIRGLLHAAGVEVLLDRTPERFGGGRLELARGDPIECDEVIALPVPEGPGIPGLPSHDGFLPIDRHCRVLGLEREFAAGDVTWFPIKQGGLAAQMADCVAAAIAELAGARIIPEPFHPILRGAILTGSGPRYLRADITPTPRDSVAARSVLWWPPAKVAGRLLAPYLAAKAGYRTKTDRPLADLAPPPGDRAGAEASDHADVVAVALRSAELDAGHGDYPGALRWLEVAEDLELYLPDRYEHKRVSWQEKAR